MTGRQELGRQDQIFFGAQYPGLGNGKQNQGFAIRKQSRQNHFDHNNPDEITYELFPSLSRSPSPPSPKPKPKPQNAKYHGLGNGQQNQGFAIRKQSRQNHLGHSNNYWYENNYDNGLCIKYYLFY
jgi:hypothetical protein